MDRLGGSEMGKRERNNMRWGGRRPTRRFWKLELTTKGWECETIRESFPVGIL